MRPNWMEGAFMFLMMRLSQFSASGTVMVVVDDDVAGLVQGAAVTKIDEIALMISISIVNDDKSISDDSDL